MGYVGKALLTCYAAFPTSLVAAFVKNAASPPPAPPVAGTVQPGLAAPHRQLMEIKKEPSCTEKEEELVPVCNKFGLPRRYGGGSNGGGGGGGGRASQCNSGRPTEASLPFSDPLRGEKREEGDALSSGGGRRFKKQGLRRGKALGE